MNTRKKEAIIKALYKGFEDADIVFKDPVRREAMRKVLMDTVKKVERFYLPGDCEDVAVAMLAEAQRAYPASKEFGFLETTRNKILST